MQAVILAGGKGTRLQPYTTVLPKPLMPVGDYPILEIVIRQLKRYGFTRIVLTVGYHYELFRAFFGDGKRWGIDIEYSFEEEPLGTAGPLRLIKDLDENFIVMNGDTLTNIDYKNLFDYHSRHGGAMTIATKKRKVNIDYGVLDYGQDKALVSYTEKPQIDYAVSMGVNVLTRRSLKIIPKGNRYDMPDLVHELIRRNLSVMCYVFDGYWLDIGRPDDYKIAIEHFVKNERKFLG
jgi:NDP-sugar pyrophosphorylase family protein